MDWINIRQALTHALKGEFKSATRCAFKMQMVRYVFSGGTAASINIITLHILVEYFSIYYLFASGIAFLIALFVSFTLHKFFTFGDTETKRVPIQIFTYVCLLGFNILLNLTFMWVAVEGFGIMYLVAQFIVSSAIAVWSFFAYRHFVFRHSTITPTNTHEVYMPQESQK